MVLFAGPSSFDLNAAVEHFSMDKNSVNTPECVFVDVQAELEPTSLLSEMW